MKHQTINLVKFKAFCKRISQPMCHAVGYLETLWIFAQIQARDGDLSKFSALEIAGWIEYPGDPQTLIDALVECRWLDRDGDRLTIHDWESHKPNWLRGVEAKAEAREAAKPEPGADPGTEPPKPKPKPKPKPSLPQPSLTVSAAARAAAEMEMLDLEETTVNANHLLKVCRNLQPEFVWQVCFIGESLRLGMIPEITGRIREGGIKKPKSYIESALRKESEALGFDWRELVTAVPKPRLKTISKQEGAPCCATSG